MATQNHTNTIPAASFGVEVDNAGRVSITAMGEIDARIAEQVAGKLLQLAHAVRAEAREMALAA